ncbi:unnamed protein product [Schistosoma mattheei]|uniref:Uncharacterized protein n=1 Tax=Schistosoma mattheei TaxID=31246 RepID=A0A183P3P1_9TREM|nr:unnamed protein product [Schistosoma mattheei]
MREVIGQRIFDNGLFKQIFLSKLPQQVQVVLASFQNNVLDELSASADRILEITKSFDAEFFSVKEMPQTSQSDITELCHTLTRYLKYRNDIPCEEALHVGDLSLDHGRRITPAGAGIIISMKSLPEIAETPQFSRHNIDRLEKRLEKLPSRHASTATVAGEHSHLSYATDVVTRVRHLVYTGAEVSVLPANSNDRLHESVLNLQAAN